MSKKVYLCLVLAFLMSLNSYANVLDNQIETEINHVDGRQGIALETNFTQLSLDIQDLMTRWNLSGGLQAAIYYNGSLVYQQSYGFAEESTLTPLENHHRFRIASLSKAVTASAIHTLVTSGDLSLDDKMVDLIPDLVPGTLEGCEYPNHSSNVDDNGTPSDTSDDVAWGIGDITVAHLLNMRAGFAKSPPDTGETERPTTSWHWEHDWMDDDSWYQGKNNPCIDDVTVASEYVEGLVAPVKIETTIRETLRLPLDFQPGSVYNYSNLGYRILGEIIEEKSGMDYQSYVNEFVLDPMGINNMRSAKTLIQFQAQNEVTYYDRNSNTWYSYFPSPWIDLNDNDVIDEGEVDFGTDDSPVEYGGAPPMEEMAASGGWIANAASYARFIAHIDGTLNHSGFDDPFNYTSTNLYFTGTVGNPYGRGIKFDVADNEHWYHTGSLPGTTTRFERDLVDGEPLVMVLLSNTRPSSDENVTVNGRNISWGEDRSNVMGTAFDTIDYKNLEIRQSSEKPALDESSPCPPGTSENGSGAHILLFVPGGTLKCYYIDQIGKRGPIFGDNGWQECPEGTSTYGTGTYYTLWNEDGGFINCYLDDEYTEEESDSLDDDRDEDRAVPSIGFALTLCSIFTVGVIFRRTDFD